MLRFDFAVVLLLGSVEALAGPLPYDRELAVELAKAYSRFDSRNSPAMALPGIDYAHPVVKSARDSAGRRYVFVSFSSAKGKWGVYTVFQVCPADPSLTPADFGRVDDIDAYRKDVARTNASTWVALADVCHEQVP